MIFVGDLYFLIMDFWYFGFVEYLGEIEDKMLVIDDGSLEFFKCVLEMFVNDK